MLSLWYYFNINIRSFLWVWNFNDLDADQILSIHYFFKDTHPIYQIRSQNQFRFISFYRTFCTVKQSSHVVWFKSRDDDDMMEGTLKDSTSGLKIMWYITNVVDSKVCVTKTLHQSIILVVKYGQVRSNLVKLSG